MKKILLTSFEPFGDLSSNSSSEVVKRIENNFNDFIIVKEHLKVLYDNQIYEDLIEKHQPDIILHCGQAGGRKTVDIENVAVNIKYSKLPDNNKVIKKGETIFEDGDTAYFSNLKVFDIVENLQKENFPINVSFSAGAYVCNMSFYSSLYYIKKKNLNTKVAFIHFPYYFGQIENSQVPFLKLEVMVDILENIIKQL